MSDSITLSRNRHELTTQKYVPPREVEISHSAQKIFNFRPLNLQEKAITLLKVTAIILFPLILIVSVIAALAYCLIHKVNYNTFIARFFGVPALRLDKSNLDTLRVHATSDEGFQKESSIQTTEIDLKEKEDSVSLNGIKIVFTLMEITAAMKLILDPWYR